LFFSPSDQVKTSPSSSTDPPLFPLHISQVAVSPFYVGRSITFCRLRAFFLLYSTKFLLPNHTLPSLPFPISPPPPWSETRKTSCRVHKKLSLVRLRVDLEARLADRFLLPRTRTFQVPQFTFIHNPLQHPDSLFCRRYTHGCFFFPVLACHFSWIYSPPVLQL